VIDRFAGWYTPAVVALAAIVAFVPPLLFGQPFMEPATGDAHGWLYRALVMLVIACPCALVISTPVTIISAIGRAAKQGVLIKGGAHLEMLGQVKAIAFDKTGTLTSGRPAVTSYSAVDCIANGQVANDHGDAMRNGNGRSCDRCDDLLALAAAVERRTAHPLAGAVVQAAAVRDLDQAYRPATDVQLLQGRGVRGEIDGRVITLGSHAHFDEEFPHPDALCMQIRRLEAGGQTTFLLAEDTTVRGYIALADQARPSSRRVVAELNDMGLATVMLTGDHAQAATAIGEEVGVTDVRAGLMPGDKVDAVVGLLQEFDAVAMVGDGVNDTPALASASVGIAMGGAGSPQALETADIALMADDLGQLPSAVRLARFARRLIRENVALSFGVKALFLTLALFGLTSLWLAILADVGIALLVTLNGMRAGRTR
jgi:Cd2+/Zn2+-exporting ATPase